VQVIVLGIALAFPSAWWRDIRTEVLGLMGASLEVIKRGHGYTA